MEELRPRQQPKLTQQETPAVSVPRSRLPEQQWRPRSTTRPHPTCCSMPSRRTAKRSMASAARANSPSSGQHSSMGRLPAGGGDWDGGVVTQAKGCGGTMEARHEGATASRLNASSLPRLQ